MLSKLLKYESSTCIPIFITGDFMARQNAKNTN